MNYHAIAVMWLWVFMFLSFVSLIVGLSLWDDGQRSVAKRWLTVFSISVTSSLIIGTALAGGAV